MRFRPPRERQHIQEQKPRPKKAGICILAAAACAAFFFMKKPMVDGPMLSVPAVQAEKAPGNCKKLSYRKLYRLVFSGKLSSMDNIALQRIRGSMREQDVPCEKRNLVLRTMELVIDSKRPEKSSVLGSIRTILENSNYDMRVVRGLHDLVSKSGGFAADAADMLSDNISDRRIRGRMLSSGFANGMERLDAALKGHPRKKELTPFVISLIRNPNLNGVIASRGFQRKIFRVADYVARKAGDDSPVALGFLGSYAESEKFRPGSLNRGAARRIIRFADAVERKNRELGEKTSYSEPLLGHERMDWRLLARITSLVSASRQSPGEVLSGFYSFMDTPRLKKLALHVLKKSRYPGHVLALMSRKYDLKKEADKDLADSIIGLVDHIAKVSGSRRHDALQELERIVGENWFTMDMIWDFRQLASASQDLSLWTFHAWMILKNAGYKPESNLKLSSDLALSAKAVLSVCGDSDTAFGFWYKLLAQEKTMRMALQDRGALSGILKLVKHMESTKAGDDTLRSVFNLIKKGYPMQKLGLLASMIDKGDKLCSNTFDLLENLMRNPGFRNSMISGSLLARLHRLAKAEKRVSDDYGPTSAIDHVLKDGRFRPSMLDSLTAIVEHHSKSDKHFIDENTLAHLDSMLESKRFRGSMLKDLAYLARKTKGRSWTAFKCVKTILESRRYRPQQLGREKLGLIADAIYYFEQVNPGESYHEGLAEAATSPYLSKPMLDVMKKLARYRTDEWNITQLGHFFAHPKYTPKLLAQARGVAEDYPGESGSLFLRFRLFMDRDDFRPEHLKPSSVKWWSDKIRGLDWDADEKGQSYHKSMTILSRTFLNPKIKPSEMESRYKEAESLMKTLGADHNSVEKCFNFVYAISVLGKTKTARLHKKLGIDYFARYSRKTLEYVYDSVYNKGIPKDKPLLLIVFAKSDHNGAFYQDYESIDTLREGRYYRILLTESGSEGEFFSRILYAGRKGKIDTLVVGGHGNTGSILLGEGGDDPFVDMTDNRKMSALRFIFGKNPLIVLISCSTGQDEDAIGALFSKIYGATTFAPKEPDSFRGFILEKSGRVKGAEYGKQHSKFVNGKMVPTTPRGFYE